MNNYYFVAISKDKQKIKGTIEASSLDELRKIVSYHDYYLVKYKKQKAKKEKFIEKSVKTKDIIDLCNNLSMMLSTGQSLLKVISLLECTTKNKGIKEFLSFTKEELVNGNSFTDCVKKYKKYFSNLFISMVEIGESSSTLPLIFDYLAKYYTNQKNIKSKIINALIYPSLLLVLSFIVVFIMCLFVLPMYEGVFNESSVNLPIYTKILFEISSFVREYFVFVVSLILLILLIMLLLIFSKKGKSFINTLVSKIIFIKNIYKTLKIYIISSSLEIMLSNNLSLVECMDILVNTINDSTLEKKFKWVSDEIKRGQTLTKAIESINYFPKMFCEMINNGENSGKLSVEMSNASKYYYNKANDVLSKIAVFIEPIMIIIISLFVGLIMISVFMPMLSLLSNIE